MARASAAATGTAPPPPPPPPPPQQQQNANSQHVPPQPPPPPNPFGNIVNGMDFLREIGTQTDDVVTEPMSEMHISNDKEPEQQADKTVGDKENGAKEPEGSEKEKGNVMLVDIDDEGNDTEMWTMMDKNDVETTAKTNDADRKVATCVEQLEAMGFDNCNGWLTKLAMVHQGDTTRVIENLGSDPVYSQRLQAAL
ncbi:unnamed protein product [Anisakis simplex]|uniref:UBA domain-containing protein n=1 Tax=Anisakis simplex TaxID=6269 RepID=A0A0M3KE83_ANISI|nr:unnamed protein product [Anisakis simplex]